MSEMNYESEYLTLKLTSCQVQYCIIKISQKWCEWILKLPLVVLEKNYQWLFKSVLFYQIENNQEHFKNTKNFLEKIKQELLM